LVVGGGIILVSIIASFVGHYAMVLLGYLLGFEYSMEEHGLAAIILIFIVFPMIPACRFIRLKLKEFRNEEV
jgi:membrane protein DedA with SNARE-associated domain